MPDLAVPEATHLWGHCFKNYQEKFQARKPILTETVIRGMTHAMVGVLQMNEPVFLQTPPSPSKITVDVVPLQNLLSKNSMNLGLLPELYPQCLLCVLKKLSQNDNFHYLSE
jgi:hypothetical protein